MGKDSLLEQLEAKKMASELKTFEVTITETLTMTVKVRATDQCEAEEKVEDDWKNSKYILTSEQFSGVEFDAAEVKPERAHNPKRDGAEL